MLRLGLSTFHIGVRLQGSPNTLLTSRDSSFEVSPMILPRRVLSRFLVVSIFFSPLFVPDLVATGISHFKLVWVLATNSLLRVRSSSVASYLRVSVDILRRRPCHPIHKGVDVEHRGGGGAGVSASAVQRGLETGTMGEGGEGVCFVVTLKGFSYSILLLPSSRFPCVPRVPRYFLLRVTLSISPGNVSLASFFLPLSPLRLRILHVHQ